VAAGVVLSAWASNAQAQAVDPGSRAVNVNARSGAVAARAPGRLVSAAFGRARDFQNRALGGTQITDNPGSQPISPRIQMRVEALQTLFTNLNLLINTFNNMIRAQAGRDPVPPVLPNFPVSNNGSGGSNGGLLGGLGNITGP